MDGHSKSQVKRLITQSPEYAAGYQAGREAGMREAAMIVRDGLIDREDIEDDDVVEAINGVINDSADAILSAIGEK